MNARKYLLLVACLLLAACNMPQNPASGARAWIDAPLDGSTLPLAPYEIIFHAYAPANPAAVQLSINGQNVEVGPADLSQPLATVHYLWSPDRPGRYVIMASSQDAKGNWSSPYIHTVMIEAATHTPTLTVTATSTPTLTPTLTPTRTLTPTVALGISLLSKSTDEFFFRGTTCGPTELTLKVQVSDPLKMKGVTLFFHLQDVASGNVTDWNSGVEMQAEGNGRFSITIPAQSIPSYDSYRQARFLYQFVGTDSKHGVIFRSPVYSDVILSYCGVLIIEPPG